MAVDAHPLPIAIVADATATPAQQELPAGVGEIIDAALGANDIAEAEAVIRAARRAYPSATEAINARVSAWRAINLPLARVPATTAVAATFASAKDASSSAESISSSSPSVRVVAEFEAGAFANTGNSPGMGLIGGFKLRAEGENWLIASLVRADYQETENLVTREQYRLSVEPNYKFNERGYIYGLGEFEQNRFQGFASRYSISGGLGYSFLNYSSAKLNVKAGPAWRVTNPVSGVRESVFAKLTSVQTKIKLTSSLDYSQDASIYVDARGSTFDTLAALDSRLIGKLKMRLSYEVQHDTAPEPGRLGTNTTSRLTLVYGP